MVNRFAQWITLAVITFSISATFTAPTKAENERVIIGATEAAQSIDLHGYVKGTVALFKTVADRDVNQNRCFGYGSLVQDHIFDLQKKSARLTLQLKTKALDTTTTLVVEDPDHQFHCADESPNGTKDAGLVLTNAKAGTYKVWIGTLDAGEARRYALNIQAQ